MTHTLELAIFALGVIIVGLIFLFPTFTEKGFTENSVLALLRQHDPSLDAGRFVVLDTPAGTEKVFTEVFAADISANGKSGETRGVREAIIESRNGAITRGYIEIFSPNAPPVEGQRRWDCPQNTYVNMSTGQTAEHLRIALTTNRIGPALLQAVMESPGFNVTDPSFASQSLELVTALKYTAIYYYSPSERAAYGQRIAEIEKASEDCREV